MAGRPHDWPPPPTHFCDWDAPGGRRVAALCGALMKRTDHQSEPTCPTCRAVLAERELE